MTHDKLMRVVDWPFFQTIKQAFLIMLIHPIQTLLMVISIAMSLCLMTFIPGLLFFGGSFIALLISSITQHIFDTIHQQTSNHPAFRILKLGGLLDLSFGIIR